MLYSKTSSSLFDYSEQFLSQSIRVLREDQHMSQRLRMTIEGFTAETPGYISHENTWVSLVGMTSITNRDITSYGEVTRNENAPLSPPMTMVTFQTGVSYVNLIGAINKGEVLPAVIISRVHHGPGSTPITTVESHTYSDCQIVLINKEDIGNVSIACIILQANAVTASYSPVNAITRSSSGSYQAQLTSSGSSTYSQE